MKVLIDHHSPFALAHGGLQIQIEQTHSALAACGVEVEWLRWWDPHQRGDVIHFIGRPGLSYIDHAHAKGMRVVIAELLTGTGSRSRAHLAAQAAVITAARKWLPGSFTARMDWESYRAADAVVALTEYEAQLMRQLFGAPPERLHVVPNGVEDVFLEPHDGTTRGPWLVCTATITERKRVLELARAAVAARAPTWIVGRPYAEGDAYAAEFMALAGAHPEFVRYEGAITDRARMAAVYREARGFVLLSTMESLSLSALEAAACGCPLLLGRLPWATTTFRKQARYCPIADTARTAAVLRSFYDDAPQLAPPARPLSWRGVAGQLKELYERVCNTSR